MTFELGIQHALNSSIVLRAGYNYCSDPIPDNMTFYNVGSPCMWPSTFQWVPP